MGNAWRNGLRRVRTWCRKHPRYCVAFGLVCVVAGAGLIAVALERETALVAVLGAVVTGGGLLLARYGVLIAAEGRPEAYVVAGVVLATVGIVVPFAFDLHWAVSAVPIASGLLLFTAGIRPLHDRLKGDEIDAKTTWQLASVASVLLGIALVLVGTSRTSPVLAALGIFFIVFGLIPLSVGGLLIDGRPIESRWAITIGLATLLAGLLFLPDGRPVWLAWVVGVIFAGLGASFVFRREGVGVVVAVIGLLLAAVLADRTDTAPLDPNPDASERILALGDSYTSGEGSTAFFAGTNVVGEKQNQCRRSSTAYPYLVASRLGMGLDFYACSGATTIQIHEEGQMDDRSPDDVPGELPQLENLPADTSDIRVVLLSIGGNDALFGDIGVACVLPGSCNAFRENWLVQVARVGPSITKAYEEIKRAVGPSTPIVAIPYPRLLTEGGCGWSALEASEHDFLFEFLTVLNDRVRRSAEQAGIYFFAPGLFAFDGAMICQGGPDDTAMNFFNVLPPEGDLGRTNPANWVHGTFHPKPAGHDAIADVLTPWLEQLLADIDADRLPPNPDPNPDATFSVWRVGARTILVDPGSLSELPSAAADCPGDQVSSFATLLPLLDESDAFTLNASPGSPICYTLPDGSWTDVEEGVVTRSENLARVQPQLSLAGSIQRFVYKDANDGSWQLRVAQFCKTKPRCPYEVNDWMSDQIGSAARRTVLPGVLVFFGAWTLSMGLRRRFHRDA